MYRLCLCLCQLRTATRPVNVPNFASKRVIEPSKLTCSHHYLKVRDKLLTNQTHVHNLDPRCWSRDNVSTWLDFTVRRNGLPFVSIERWTLFNLSFVIAYFSQFSFKMNGKGLSLMTMDMFSARAPNGGKTLFKVQKDYILIDALISLNMAWVEIMFGIFNIFRISSSA